MRYRAGIVNISALIAEAERALSSGCHFASFALALTLVARCAKDKYPNEWFDKNAQADSYLKENFPRNYNKNGIYTQKHHDAERFTMWCDDWENLHDCNDEIVRQKMEEYQQSILQCRKTPYGLIPKLDGNFIYQIRCYFLHEMSNDIDFTNKLTDVGNRSISKFAFVVQEQSPFFYSNHITTIDSRDISYDVNIGWLIQYLLYLVKQYCKNKEMLTVKIVDFTDTYFK